MKKLIRSINIFIFLCFTLSINAQISIGPKVGVNIANWSGSFDEDYYSYYYEEFETKSITGSQFGISIDIKINDMVSIQPEILYIQKGVSLRSFNYFVEFYEVV